MGYTLDIPYLLHPEADLDQLLPTADKTGRRLAEIRSTSHHVTSRCFVPTPPTRSEEEPPQPLSMEYGPGVCGMA